MQCAGTTKAGKQCKNKACMGSTTCRLHMAQQQVAAPQDHRCTAITQSGNRCKHSQVERGLCTRHLNMYYEDNYQRVLFTIRMLPNRHAAEELIGEWFMTERIGEVQMDRLFAQLGIWFPYQFAAHHAPAAPQALVHIANDAQNVHTAQVSAQTQRAMDVLLAIPVPEDQTTTWEVLTKFMPRVHTQGPSGLNTYTDVDYWYHTATCVAPNDNLYKRLLDGCVAYIDASPHKNELWLRLEQEMDESVGMCCMGHLTRLCNTFIGFDDRFAPPVPVGELLQQKMAAIAAKDIETYQKVEEANAVFEELHVPQDQREAWLEAF